MMVHVANLPPDAMTHGAWKASDELAAQQVEVMHEVLRVTIAGFRIQLDRKDAARIKVPDPYRVPRPGQAAPSEAPAPKKLSRESIRRALLGG